MHVAEISWHRSITRTWRSRLFEAASRAARRVSRCALRAEDHPGAVLWKQRQLWFEEKARLAGVPGR